MTHALPYFLPTVLPGPITAGQSALFIATDMIKIVLPETARIDSTYSSTASYFINVRSDSPVEDASGVQVIEVLLPSESSGLLAVNYVYLRTTAHTLGAFYEVTHTGLSTPGGVPINSSTNPYQARRTKTMSMLSSIPGHFYKGADGLLRNLITAISLEDDVIGGSRRDEF